MDASQIISLWPSPASFAEDIGLLSENHARTMKARNSIPRAYWPEVIEAAARRGLPVDKDVLKSAERPRKRPAASNQNAISREVAA